MGPDAADGMTIEDQAREWTRCEASPIYFLRTYGWVFNVNEEAWVPFDLWPAQAWALVQMEESLLVAVLKARQLGFTWLTLGFGLWLMLFRAAAALGIFSRIETDAQDLLDFRLKGMYERLPGFLQADAVTMDNKSRWELSNGSMALAFPTTGGRQYTFSLVLVDEADHQPDLDSLMVAAKPTTDAGGRMVLLSSVDKSRPNSRFKQIYRGAKTGRSGWQALFLPWWARPGRTAAWYEAQKADALASTGSLDDLHQEYPATDTEALAGRTLDKRIPSTWMEACYRPADRLPLPPGAPVLEQLEIYQEPEFGRQYVIGIDPAEGNPTSDDSALTVLDRESGEEVAALAGKFQPATMAAHAHSLGVYYSGASLMVERNNHGHAVLLWLRDNSDLRVLDGRDEKPGWVSSTLGKTILYDELADGFRQEQIILHSFGTFTQVASIEGSSLRAPDGQRDDRSDSLALAHVGRSYAVGAKVAAVAASVVSRDRLGL